MPVSPSGVSEISACHFRICWSLDKLWIFLVWLATINYGLALKSETMKTPSMLQSQCRVSADMLILSNPLLEFCLSTPAFSSIILFHMFIPAFHILKIPEHSFWTRDTLKKVTDSLSASLLKPSAGEWQALILLWSVGWISDISLQIKNIRQSGRLPKYSSSVLIPQWPCNLWNLVADSMQSSARWQSWGAERSCLHKHWFLIKFLV